ncbi:MAG: HlyD family efflux transporter periplasmic adaptor subunit [Candidatus Hydrogenedens sp.]|nr:HlyD family efflux transporter periplasmic adaptor subunit [Candidatus Hydrogenedens sp.]
MKPNRRLLMLGAAGALALAAAWGGWRYFKPASSQTVSAGTTFTVARGPLEVLVLEGGSIEALNSQEIKSEVQGETKILSIIPEGYLITPQDVENSLVLVELDSKNLLDSLTERELSYQRAFADFTQAREQYEIQRSENQSQISAAELEMRFALMDFQKYLGEAAAEEVRNTSGVEALAEGPARRTETGGALDDSEGGVAEQTEEPAPELLPVDFSQYADPDRLGDGEAMQKLRQTLNDFVLAQEELEAARTQLEGTQRLYEKEFVTQQELEKDQLALQRAEIKVDTSETSKDMFIRYEFPKQAEKLLSDYGEALRKLDRMKKQSVAKIAQAEATLKSAEAQYELQSRRKRELEEQIEKCVIHATKTGLVVYGAGPNDSWRDDIRIEEGASVRERQIIITIPDTSVMKVGIKVHESYVKKVKVGQKARIRVDAYPNESLVGEVTKIGVLPDSQNRWSNPDLKVYATDIVIKGTHDWLKPGMTAEVEVIIEQLSDVTYAPLQAINPTLDGPVVFVKTALGEERRSVKTGEFNDTFIEIKDGVEQGEVVLLRAPDDFRRESEEAASGGERKTKGKEEAGGDGGEGA